jgi:hypothetical protein
MTYSPDTPVTYEVSVRVFRKTSTPADDKLLAYTNIPFKTIKEVTDWIEKAGVTFV